MLYSTVLNLRALNDEAISATQGYHGEGLLLKLLEATSPPLAAEMHSLDGPKPFTISPLREKGSATRVATKIRTGALYWLRITFLEEDVFAHFMAAVARNGKAPVRLGEANFEIGEVAAHPQASPWAAFTTFEQLLERASTDRHITLQFLSPTAFRSGGKRNVALPEPGLVFGSLLSRWNTYSPLKLSVSLKEAAENDLLVARYKLETRILDYGNYKEVGFEGMCSYEMNGAASEETIVAFNALADFAFYSGTGAKTTMGMGQTRRIQNARSLSNRTRSNA